MWLHISQPNIMEAKALTERERRRKYLGGFKMGRYGWPVERRERAKLGFLKLEQVSHTFPVGEGGG